MRVGGFRAVSIVVAAAGVAALARRWRALSPSGAVAATAAGSLTVAGAGVRGGAALAAFFVSSSLLGRLPRSNAWPQRRGHERDAVQVLANGGVAMALATAAAFASVAARRLLLAGVGGALAAAAADTWATEIGSRSRQKPRSIVTGKPVPIGASGGVTWAGLAASMAGAAMVSGVMTTGETREFRTARCVQTAIAVGGVTGALVDSVLGATAQEVRFCDVCLQETEMRRHECGRRTRLIRGVFWCDNDMVNAIATAVGAASASAILGLAIERQDWPRGNDRGRLC